MYQRKKSDLKEHVGERGRQEGNDPTCSIKMSERWQGKTQTAEHWTYGWTLAWDREDTYRRVLLSNCGKAASMAKDSFLTASLILMSSVAQRIRHWYETWKKTLPNQAEWGLKPDFSSSQSFIQEVTSTKQGSVAICLLRCHKPKVST